MTKKVTYLNIGKANRDSDLSEEHPRELPRVASTTVNPMKSEEHPRDPDLPSGEHLSAHFYTFLHFLRF